MAVRAGLRKHWKDSAGLVLVTGAFKYARPPTLFSKLASLGKNPIIVPLDDLAGTGDAEWETAMVKRSAKTGFFANNYVFPGGRIDRADSSQRWQELFCHCSNPHSDPFHSILALRSLSKTARLPIYAEVSEGPILGEIALRICAIRELFEEAGVLLARESGRVADIVGCLPGTFPPAVKTLTSVQMNYWRERVHNDAEEFLNLCSELQCVPDIWSLVEWSDWLTPRNMHRRYDTVFYLCFLETRPHIAEDGEEVVDAKWYSPSEAIRLYSEQKIRISPPQFADISFLKSLGSVPCLHSYAVRKVLRGSTYRNISVRILTKDKVMLSVTNADDIYPALPEEEAITAPPPHSPQSPSLAHVHLLPSEMPAYEYTCPTHSAEELRNLSVRMSRLEFHDVNRFFFYDTVRSEDLARHIDEYDRAREQLDQLNSKL